MEVSTTRFVQCAAMVASTPDGLASGHVEDKTAAATKCTALVTGAVATARLRRSLICVSLPHRERCRSLPTKPGRNWGIQCHVYVSKMQRRQLKKMLSRNTVFARSTAPVYSAY